MDIDVPADPQQVIDRASQEKAPQDRSAGPADDDIGNTALLCEIDHHLGDVAAFQGDGPGSGVFRQHQVVSGPVAIHLRRRSAAWALRHARRTIRHGGGRPFRLRNESASPPTGSSSRRPRALASGEFAVVAIVPLNVTCEYICPTRCRALTKPLRPASDGLALGSFGRRAIEGDHVLFEDSRGLFHIRRVRQLLAEQMMLGELADAAQ